MKSLLTSAALIGALAAAPALAADKYMLDASHSQIVFSYNHLGASTTYGMFSGFEGEIMFDEANPTASTVSVSMPVKSMFTGWEARTGHFMSPDFFNASDEDMVTFTSTAIEVTGDNVANITGDLTLNGVTKSVVLDAKLNQKGEYPFGANQGKPWLGFDATTTLTRSDFNLGAFAPAVSDAVDVKISIEALGDS